MTVWNAFTSGWARIGRHKRVIVWLYLLNVLFAAVLIAPARALLGEIEKRDVSQAFVSGFSLDAFLDVLVEFETDFAALGYMALALSGLYLLLNIFLTAGIVASMATDHTVSFRRFCTSSARYFWRYLRLFVLLLIVIGLLGWGYGELASEWLEQREKEAVTDMAGVFWQLIGPAGLLLVISAVLMVFDYARIRTVLEQRRGALKATIVSLGFCIRRMFHAAPLFYLNVVLAGLLMAAYLLVAGFFAADTLTSVLVLFGIQQLFILGRIVVRLSFFASQTAYCQAVQAERASATVGADLPSVS